MSFNKTDRQREAIKLLMGDATHSMLFGGSRSGKTAILVYAMIVRACKEKSRHVILRSHFNHVRTSIFMDTMPKILGLAFPDLSVEYNKSDSVLYLPNGSEIWHSGLDDSQRVEKILGKEYSTIFFNECSQIDYNSVSVALTRLAEKNNLRKKVYYDENPPSKSHWSYWQFIKKLNPADNEPLSIPDNYNCMLMNPRDNLQNIDQDYIKILEQLPENERRRFLDGVFNDSNDGVAYYSFNRERHVMDTERSNSPYYISIDFNVMPMTSIIFQIQNDKIVVHDEAFLLNSDTYKMVDHLKGKGFSGCDLIPDSTGANRKTSGKSDFQILRESGFNILKVHNPLQRDRVLNVNRLFVDDRIIINPRCKKLINDLEKVGWKNDNLDEGNDKMLTHISDCLGYGAHRLMPLIVQPKSTCY